MSRIEQNPFIDHYTPSQEEINCLPDWQGWEQFCRYTIIDLADFTKAFRQRSLGLWGPVLLRDRKRRWLDVPSSSSWSRKGRGNFIDGGGGGGGVERLRVTNIDDVDGLRSLEGKEFGAPFRSILLPNPYFRAPRWNCISFISFNPSKFAQTCWVVRHDQELDHDSSSCSSISRHVCVSISVSSFSLN